VTLGTRGSFGCDGREEILSPPIRVEAVDTTGAGDIFHAGFLYALLGGLSFREILAFANTAAGLSCRGMGGRAAIPTIAEIRAAGASPDRMFG
jgi:sugar/nucleoside kinase (ribokinase family)